MPGTDGIELMQTVPELADLPVIFISGYGRDETISRALEAGASNYIVKPFSPTELTARIRAALRRRTTCNTAALRTRSSPVHAGISLATAGTLTLKVHGGHSGELQGYGAHRVAGPTIRGKE